MEMVTDLAGGTACAWQAAPQLGNEAFAALWNRRADGSLPGVRSQPRAAANGKDDGRAGCRVGLPAHSRRQTMRAGPEHVYREGVN